MKKFLSILLTAMMLASVLIVPANAFVPTRNVDRVSNVFINQDYSDTTTNTAFTIIDADFNKEVIGAGDTTFDVVDEAMQITNAGYSSFAVFADFAKAIPDGLDKITLEFDVTTLAKVADSLPSGAKYGVYFTTKGLYAAKPEMVIEIGIDLSSYAANETGTYKVEFYPGDALQNADGPTYGTAAAVWRKNSSGGYDQLTRHSQFKSNGFTVNADGTFNGKSFAEYNDKYDATLGCRRIEGTGAIANIPVKLDNIKFYAADEVTIENYSSVSGLKYTNDAESAFVDGIVPNTSQISVSEATENGNGYYVLKPLADNAVQVGLAMDNYLDYGQTLTFDLRSDNEGSKSLKILGFNATRDARIVNILINGLTANKWYSYKIVIGNSSNDIVVYRKDRGAADSTYVVIPENSGWEKDSAGIGSFKGLYLGFRTAGGAYANTQYSIDNVQVRDSIAYAGNLSKTDATLVIDTPENNETVFMASYDGSRLVDVDFKTLDGGDNKAELSVAAGTAATKIFVWNLAEDGTTDIIMTPIEIQ